MNFVFHYAFLTFLYLTSARAKTSQESCCDNPECVQETIQTILDKLSVGIRKGNEEVSDNPLVYADALMYHIDIPTIKYLAVTTNNNFEGLADSVVSDARVRKDGENTVITFKTVTPHLNHSANYTMVGSLQTLEGFTGEIRLNETGTVVFSYDNATFEHTLTLGTKENTNGKTVLRARNYKVKVHADEYKASFGNLFGGKDKKRSDAYSAFLTKSLKKVVKQIGPEIDCAYSKVFGRVAQIILNGVLAERLCPSTKQTGSFSGNMHVNYEYKK